MSWGLVFFHLLSTKAWLLFFKTTSAILLIFPLHFQINFRKNLSISITKNIAGKFNQRNQINLGKTVIFTMLSLPIQEHRSLISFISILYFSAYRTWTCLVRFIHSIFSSFFLFFCAIVNSCYKFFYLKYIYFFMCWLCILWSC